MQDRIKVAASIQKARPHIPLEDCFKTPCTSAVLGFFGIGKKQFSFCQFVSDMRAIFKKDGWRTVKQKLPTKINWDCLSTVLGRGYYFVSIKDHVFLIYISDEQEMRVDVDTDPEQKWAYPQVEDAFKIELIKSN